MSIYAHRIKKIEMERESFSISEIDGLIDYSSINDSGAGIQTFDFEEIEEYIEKRGDKISFEIVKQFREDIGKSIAEGKDYVEYYFY